MKNGEYQGLFLILATAIFCVYLVTVYSFYQEASRNNLVKATEGAVKTLIHKAEK